MSASFDLPRSSRGSVAVQRRFLRGEGGVSLAQVMRGTGVRAVVVHGASLVADVHVGRGALSFPLASTTIEAPRRFRLFIPAGAVLPMRFDDALVESRGHAIFGAAAEPQASIAFDGACIALDADKSVASTWVAARRLLHEELAARAPVARVAAAIGIAPDTLARGLVRAYGLAPKEYVHRARVFAAVIALLRGASVIDAGFGAGFNDVTRFYEQFRRRIGVPPGVYARVGKRQDGARNGA